jgi:HTH-type transcriptional regulator / antitoxin HigA
MDLRAVRPLRTVAAYEAALIAIRPYFENEPAEGSPEADHFDMLALVINAYEDEHHPIPQADPIATVQLIMEANGFTRAQLAEILGGAPRVSEFLRGRRDLTLTQIRRLHREWKIPSDALIGVAA